jgi:hypothetical protein
MDIVNQITMEYLADKNFSQQTNRLESDRYSISDLKFYRKRILNLVKERIVIKFNKEKTKQFDDIDKILDLFYESCINKFKIEDYHELQQAELSVFSDKTNNDISLDDVRDNVIYNNLEECNQLLYANTEDKTVTLDNFVIKNNGTLEMKKDYPRLNKINIRDKKLKYKGISREKSK